MKMLPRTCMWHPSDRASCPVDPVMPPLVFYPSYVHTSILLFDVFTSGVFTVFLYPTIKKIDLRMKRKKAGAVPRSRRGTGDPRAGGGHQQRPRRRGDQPVGGHDRVLEPDFVPGQPPHHQHISRPACWSRNLLKIGICL